ncbi:hypothetical protein TWF718_001071 [Orbilia javanica]|uniref:CCHC-type domain-containing protein n=1 Tax=Orbilia javanica TaxID=47235 RepID=A0AAN8RGK3_9PEZI
MASKSSSQASKPVSSRLLNMKFMQKPLSSSTSPTSKTPPSKHHSTPQTTTTTTTTKNVSKSAILAAQALESSRREAAINSSSLGAAERWSLSLPASERANEIRGGGEMVGSVKVYMTGNTLWNTDYAHQQDGGMGNNDISDSGDDEDEIVPVAPVRRYFGGRTAPVAEKKSNEDDEDDDDQDDVGDSDEDTSASESEVLRRIESKRAAKALKKEKDADRALRNLKQIGGRATANGAENIECFACGETGHRKSDCPSLASKGSKHRPSKPNRGGGVKREYDSFGGPAIKKQRRY